MGYIVFVIQRTHFNFKGTQQVLGDSILDHALIHEILTEVNNIT